MLIKVVNQPRKVIITGINGQDGSFMSELLLSQGHYVIGVARHSSNPDSCNLKKSLEHPSFRLVKADICDSFAVNALVKDIKPDYFINFAGQSFVKESWNTPKQTMEINCSGVLNCLEAIRFHAPHCRFYNAGSSEAFGKVEYSPQDIKHPMNPLSPYGASKGAAHLIVKAYRDSFNLFVVNGICFNHESERRQDHFVTRKITKGVARIAKSIYKGELFDPIVLGNVNTVRDWSHAKDFVDGIWLMLNASKPKDYILSSGEAHTLREFISLAFKRVLIEPIETIYREPSGWIPRTTVFQTAKRTPLVESGIEFYRPADVVALLGDSGPIRNELGWSPKYTFHDLVNSMIDHDFHSN